MTHLLLGQGYRHHSANGRSDAGRLDRSPERSMCVARPLVLLLAVALVAPGETAAPLDRRVRPLAGVLPIAAATAVELPAIESADDLIALALSPDGRHLAISTRRRWDRGGDPILLREANDPRWRDLGGARFFSVRDLGWGRSASELLVADAERVWSLSTAGAAPRRTRYRAIPRWNPAGTLYAVADDDGFARFTSSGREIGPRIRGALAPTWSPSGRWLAYAQRREPPSTSPRAEFSPTCEIRLLPARGRVPVVAWSWAAWRREQQQRHWSWAAGPWEVYWTPDGRSLVGLIDAREGEALVRYLRRYDLASGRAALVRVPSDARLLGHSRHWRTWLVYLDGSAFRVELREPNRASSR